MYSMSVIIFQRTPNIIWDAIISLGVINLSPFIGTYTLGRTQSVAFRMALAQQTMGNINVSFYLYFAFVFPSRDILNGYVTNTLANNHGA